MNIYRYPKNPLITPLDVPPLHEGFEVIGAFNAGVTKYQDETILLLRVAERPISEDPMIVKAPIYNIEKQSLDILEFNKSNKEYDFEDPRTIRRKDKLQGFSYLTSLSYIRIARSKDGHRFTIDKDAFICPFNRYQTFGIEDARCTQIGDTYYINFSSVSEMGVCDSLVATKDFVTYQDLGNIFAPENKDVLLFPEKINGKYYALHRPSLKSIGNHDIWIASSPDLLAWGDHHHLIGIRPGSWDGGRIGGGLVPIKTEKGWLEIYHGATEDHRYCMGAVLLDLDDPTKVIARTIDPIMEPEEDYEKEGFFGEVVFGCGGIIEGDKLIMYYGVADTSMAACELSISEILDQLEKRRTEK
ncbi:MAG: glycoside hydrolase family 130 protein [Virgibacillus proomii]|jgi:beta-1,2-mannobiose phosphorylase / 1,2-beta-oligomannan phosphorylase